MFILTFNFHGRLWTMFMFQRKFCRYEKYSIWQCATYIAFIDLTKLCYIYSIYLYGQSRSFDHIDAKCEPWTWLRWHSSTQLRACYRVEDCSAMLARWRQPLNWHSASLIPHQKGNTDVRKVINCSTYIHISAALRGEYLAIPLELN